VGTGVTPEAGGPRPRPRKGWAIGFIGGVEQHKEEATLSANPQKRRARISPILVSLVMGGGSSPASGLIFRPEPPGDQGRLALPVKELLVEAEDGEMRTLVAGLEAGALGKDDLLGVLDELKDQYSVECPAGLKQVLLKACKSPKRNDFSGDLKVSHHLEDMALVGVRIIDRMQKTLLTIEPLTEIHFLLSDRAKVALRLSWEAMAKHGRFPLSPKGARRLNALREKPAGVLHFVSASDGDAGYFYTIGIALSPEAQTLDSMDVSYGLDGELIVPGQAVAPIPPFLAMSTRLFAASIPTSSNISEDIQAIPYSSFAHPEVIDIEPARGYLFRPRREAIAGRAELAKDELREQLKKYWDFVERTPALDREFLPDVGAAIDVTDVSKTEIVRYARSVLQGFNGNERKVTALFLFLSSGKAARVIPGRPERSPRVIQTSKVIDAAKQLGLRYVAVCDEDEDEWLPNLLEYFTSEELNYLADYSDARGVILCDGRPVDPVYTASTSAQRIQSVFTTLSVDILKMGMWLCLDALTARRVWRELHRNPHIPERMFLMPIGIVEPFCGFVDNRSRSRTPRAIIDPFKKIKFMIEEARVLGAPSLLTDTRHKDRWVLLGSVDGDLPPHVREQVGAIPLIGRKKFMKCEQLARKAGILLGQAGSIESDQIFWIISDTTLDAAMDRQNPATAIWTAETERVLRTADGSSLRGDLQQQRRSAILPYLAVTNRAFESHAKLDGWLRYLTTKGKGDEALREKLIQKRDLVHCLQNTVVTAQRSLGKTPAEDSPQALGGYQKAWNAFSSSFLDYHAEVKKHFKPVRDQVDQVWKTLAKSGLNRKRTRE
jgi:hypothetical protein